MGSTTFFDGQEYAIIIRPEGGTWQLPDRFDTWDQYARDLELEMHRQAGAIETQLGDIDTIDNFDDLTEYAIQRDTRYFDAIKEISSTYGFEITRTPVSGN